MYTLRTAYPCHAAENYVCSGGTDDVSVVSDFLDHDDSINKFTNEESPGIAIISLYSGTQDGSAGCTNAVNQLKNQDLSGFEPPRSKTPTLEITTEEDNEKRPFQCRTTATKSGSYSQWTDEDGNKSTVFISSTSEYESTVETTSEGLDGGKDKITVVSGVKSVADDTCKEISKLPPPFMKAMMARRLTESDVELIEHQDTEDDHFCDEQMAHPWKGQEINRRTTVYHLKRKDRGIQSDDAASANSATESKTPSVSETRTTTPTLRHIAPLLKPTPKLHASILTPLFLNGNPMQTVRTHQAGHNRQPTYQVVNLESEQGTSALYQLTPSLAAPKYCTISLYSSRVHWTDLLLLYNAPVEQSKMVDRKIHKVDLLMPPEGPLVALKLDPTWYSINYLLAHGKHIAVPYRIPHMPLHRARKIKAEIGKTQLVDAKILYKEAKMEPTILLESFKANPIRLATVEERDPECVQHIRLCQEAIEWPKELVMQPQTQVSVQEVKVKHEPTLPPSFSVQLQNHPQQQSQQIAPVKKEVFSKDLDLYTEDAKPSDSGLSTAPCKGIAAPNAIVVRSNANEGGQKLIVDKDGRREGDDICEALLLIHERIKHIKKTGGAIIEYPEEVRRYHSHYLLKKHGDKTIVQKEISELRPTDEDEDDDEDSPPIKGKDEPK
ncbi:hypothetical protein WR25_18454 [Diploscapter pachys]|uniref:Uncharacterized protein n=1 Tax=Diploscapter pachys TaxID=2018661 RepID=A0A2A2K244_9BILA|nr:hypothetical protein WR25_18454 [Diploscapter pachys]